MDDLERSAFAAFFLELIAACSKLAVAFGVEPPAPPDVVIIEPAYERTTAQLPWQERVLRQCLILNEISLRGGNVPQKTFYEIAAYYGYSGRGVAGFFRGDSQGLLNLGAGNRVYITKRGKDRLSGNIERVLQALAKEEDLVYKEPGQ